MNTAYVKTDDLDEHFIRLVWQSAAIIPNYPKEMYRIDIKGRIIQFDQFGSGSKHGWRIININPSNPLSRTLHDLQPLNHNSI